MTDQKFPMVVALTARPKAIDGLEDGGAYLVTAKADASILVQVGRSVPQNTALPQPTFTAGLLNMWEEEAGEYRYMLHPKGFDRCLVWLQKGAGHTVYVWSPSDSLSVRQAEQGLEVSRHEPELHFPSEVEILNRMLRLEATMAKAVQTQRVPWNR